MSPINKHIPHTYIIFHQYLYLPLVLGQAFLSNQCRHRSGPEVIKLFLCSTQLSMKFSLLLNMKMPATVCIFIFIIREIFMLIYI